MLIRELMSIAHLAGVGEATERLIHEDRPRALLDAGGAVDLVALLELADADPVGEQRTRRRASSSLRWLSPLGITKACR